MPLIDPFDTIPPTISVDCFCTPPNRLVANSEKPSDRCEVCGAEVLTGVLTTEPRLRLVKDDE